MVGATAKYEHAQNHTRLSRFRLQCFTLHFPLPCPLTLPLVYVGRGMALRWAPATNVEVWRGRFAEVGRGVATECACTRSRRAVRVGFGLKIEVGRGVPKVAAMGCGLPVAHICRFEAGQSLAFRTELGRRADVGAGRSLAVRTELGRRAAVGAGRSVALRIEVGRGAAVETGPRVTVATGRAICTGAVKVGAGISVKAGGVAVRGMQLDTVTRSSGEESESESDDSGEGAGQSGCSGSDSEDKDTW